MHNYYPDINIGTEQTFLCILFVVLLTWKYYIKICDICLIQVLVTLYQETKTFEVNIHLVETGHSLLREVPGVEIIDYEVCNYIFSLISLNIRHSLLYYIIQDDDSRMSLDRSKEMLKNSEILKHMDIQLVYGVPGYIYFIVKIVSFMANHSFHTGVGKSHYIRKQLANAPQSVTISVNEMFTRKRCIEKLSTLSYDAEAAISFNFTVTYPGVRQNNY